MTRLSTAQALEKWQRILFEVKHEFDANIDEIKPLKMQPYAHSAIDLQEYRRLGCTTERRAITNTIRSHFFNLKLNRHMLTLGASVAFGVGACAESTAQAFLKYAADKALLQAGYLLNFALSSVDDLEINHNFLMFIPQDMSLAPPEKNTSFSLWLRRIDQSCLNRVILVDVWRSVITPLDGDAKNSLLTSLEEFKMDRVVGNSVHFSERKVKEDAPEILKQYFESLEEVYNRECCKPEVMGFFMQVRKKESGLNELTRRLQDLYPLLTFSNYTRAGFYTDAIAELTTPEMRQAATDVLTQITSAKLRKYNEVPILVIEKINANVELAAQINELWEAKVRPTLTK